MLVGRIFLTALVGFGLEFMRFTEVSSFLFNTTVGLPRLGLLLLFDIELFGSLSFNVLAMLLLLKGAFEQFTELFLEFLRKADPAGPAAPFKLSLGELLFVNVL